MNVAGLMYKLSPTKIPKAAMRKLMMRVMRTFFILSVYADCSHEDKKESNVEVRSRIFSIFSPALLFICLGFFCQSSPTIVRYTEYMKYLSGVWLSPTISALGKKYGIDAHYFAKNSFLVLLGHTLSILRGIISGYLVARFFNKEVYGQYQFILSFMGVFTVFGLGGLATSVTRAWSRGDAFSLTRVSLYQLRICLLGSFGLLLCIPFLSHYSRQELWPLFFAAAVIFPLPTIAMVRFGGYTVGLARFDLSLRVSVVWTTLVIVATLAIIAFRQSALLMLLSGTAIPPLVYLWYSRNFRPPKEVGDTNTKSIIRYGWHLTLSTLPVELVGYLDKLFISHYLGLAQLATFSVAMLIPEQVKFLLKQFIPVTFSKQAEKGDSYERRRKLIKVVLIGVLIFAVGITVYILLCPYIIPLLFPQYDSKQVVLLTSLTAVTLIVQPMALLSQYLEAQRMIRELWLSNLVAAIVFGFSMSILIPAYGLLGAVIARGIFRFASASMSWWFVLRSPVMKAESSLPRA